MSDWVKLPELQPKELAASREIKVLFTGDLERTIYTNPYFFGQEKHYLRAQISRIVHSTTLYPKGLKRLDEEGKVEANEPDGDDPLPVPTTTAMNEKSMWLHANASILKNCRTTQLEPEEQEEGDPEEIKAAMEKADPAEPRLKPIADDDPVALTEKMKQDAWSVRMMGDPTEYANEKDPKSTQTICNGVVVVRSLLWPGAYSFYYGGRVLQLYLGNGHKFQAKSTFFPISPPVVMADPEEDSVQPEPSGELPKEEKPEGEDGEGEGEGEGEEEEGGD